MIVLEKSKINKAVRRIKGNINLKFFLCVVRKNGQGKTNKKVVKRNCSGGREKTCGLR